MRKHVQKPINKACSRVALLATTLLCSGGISQTYAAECSVLTQPVNLSVVENTGTAVTLKWDPVAGVSNYNLLSYINGAYKRVSSTAPQATFSNLPADYYYFAVTAHNSCDEQSTPSDWFAVDVTGIGQCVLPEIPQQLTGSNITASGFTASWADITNADNYQVQLYTGSSWQDRAVTVTSSYDFTNLNLGSQHVRVNASNSCGSSEFSAPLTVEIKGQNCPSYLDRATNLVATGITADSFTINWTGVVDADQYRIEVWQGYWAEVGTTREQSFNLTNLAAKSTQYVHVIALNCDGSASSESNWLEVNLSQVDPCPVEIPQATGLTSSNITASGFTLTWNRVNEAERYIVERLVNGTWTTVTTTTANTYTFGGLNQASRHEVRIVSVASCGSTSTSIALMVDLVENCPTSLATPSNLRLADLTNSGFNASWGAVTGAKKYQVQLATAGQWQNFGPQTQLSKTFSNLTAGTYQVKVAAVCDNTYSAETTPQQIIIEDVITTPSCDLPDVDGGVTISKLRASDEITEGSLETYVSVRNLDNNYSMKITCAGKYGTAERSRDDAPYYLGFKYNYNHLNARADNVEEIQFEVTSNGRVSRKTLSWPISVPVVMHPVQPSCANVNIDNDQDGIPDCAEEPGKTFFGMPVYDWGARKNTTDIFLEVDYMSKESSNDLGTEPRREAFEKVKQIFAEHGYNLHFDVGNLYGQGPENFNLGGGQAVQYSPWIGLSDWQNEYDGYHDVPGMKNNDLYPGVFSYMPVYFDNKPERARLFYYSLFASSQAASGQGSSGQAPDYFDQYFYVSLGRNNWNFSVASEAETNRLINSQASLIMHEFGHILGLSHGGWPDKYPSYEPNYKPNYTSVMNYSYALSGTPHNKNGNEGEMISDRHHASVRWNQNANCAELLNNKYGAGSGRRNIPGGLSEDWRTFNLDYSYGSHANLSESSYNEASVLGGQDFNCNGNIENTTGPFDLNYDNSHSNMRDYNDWSNIYNYFRSLNYSTEGVFLAQPNPRVAYANEPADIVPGAIASPTGAFAPSIQSATKDSRPIGVPEMPMSPEH
ncbi:fibronectin type III domain-containing protein [Colwellia psychrerythraea]|uniref:Fibronectin type III domain protein n=1 Tax=Colwellia psychrerythraea TaxID=28229 RepID=A0A099KVY2_COLPS|nr:fibronectin type III domain-containing protein [Colwellia psychrerythraea]KGJ94012.1 Fibronectin type III domain protein [Colwellia psychrerythraea]